MLKNLEKKRKKEKWLSLLSFIFFPLAILYEEILLKACVGETPLFDRFFI